MFSKLMQLPTQVKQYLIITGNYWAFTLTDGALRMLVVLYFHQLGYSPFNIAMLFLFYEIFGVVTNLVGGWLGSRLGLNKTMNIGLGLQIASLAMLAMPAEWLTIALVMCAQALSGIAKDLNKMSAKSSIKYLVPKEADNTLYRWIAILTGSKNTLKGVGFFLGGTLLTLFGFQQAIILMAALLTLVWVLSLLMLYGDIGKAKSKTKFTDVFSKSQRINLLSAARLFLFAARDVWFVVALPVFLASQFQWDFWQVGGFLASWIILYGGVQAVAPKITGQFTDTALAVQQAHRWAIDLAAVTVFVAIMIEMNLWLIWVTIIGLLAFGFVFAINSSLHSFLIVHLADDDGASLDVGFYYMANAMGRLTGTVLSGWVYQNYGLVACLTISVVFIIATILITQRLKVNVSRGS